MNAAEFHPRAEITILEKTTKLLSKVLISGGGRCNVTHACFENNLLVKNYPRGEKELRGAFSKFTTTDTITWFLNHGVNLKTEVDGRMFPASDNSETIANCLFETAERLNVKIKTSVGVKEIIVLPDKTFILHTTADNIKCDKLIIACGGNSKNEAYDWLRKVGHTVIPPVPSLFTFNIPANDITKLMGVSVPHVKIKIAGTKLQTEGPLLITHWGLSGPAVLKASAEGARILNEKKYHFTVLVNWLPALLEEDIRSEIRAHKEKHPAKLLITDVLFGLPRRLWEFFLFKAGIMENTRCADLSKKQFNALVEILRNDTYEAKGKTTFKEEFVSCGGVDLKEIDFSDMQSKTVPNLYFAGEVLNIDGITGGFNFQNAWTTAWIAAKACSA